MYRANKRCKCTLILKQDFIFSRAPIIESENFLLKFKKTINFKLEALNISSFLMCLSSVALGKQTSISHILRMSYYSSSLHNISKTCGYVLTAM